MRRVFADTVYWVALANPRDQWHGRTVQVSQSLGRVRVETTEDVFDGFLTHFSGCGRAAREGAVRFFEAAASDPDVVLLPQDHASFLAGVALYRSRPDKAYSLTDCISMDAMRREGLDEILTHDDHFRQEGSIVLL